MAICPNCRYTVAEGQKFCDNCGSAITAYEPYRGTQTTGNNQFDNMAHGIPINDPYNRVDTTAAAILAYIALFICIPAGWYSVYCISKANSQTTYEMALKYKKRSMATSFIIFGFYLGLIIIALAAGA